MPANVTNEINALKSSVTFAMSLGAKELFHTNFIAFLLESDDPSLRAVRQNIATLFGITITNNTKIYTWREKHNLDLVIIAVNYQYSANDDDSMSCHSILEAYVCVIEAKLKSIPTIDQLVSYDAKLGKGLRFDLNDSDYLNLCSSGLLTGFKLNFDINTNHKSLTLIVQGKAANQINPVNSFKRILLSQIAPSPCPWSQVYWDQLANIILSTLGNMPVSTISGLNVILNDYVDHLLNLVAVINKEVLCSQSTFLPLSNFKYRDLCNEINQTQFKKIRIHDLVGKVVFNEFENRMSGLINQPCLLNKQTNLLFHSYTHYSNQQPGIGFEWRYVSNINQHQGKKIKKIFSIGVQIQGSDYRHYIATSTEWSGLGALSKNLGDWFSPQTNTCLAELKGKKINEFYKFNENKFLYSKKNIDDLTFDELSACVMESMRLACNSISNQNAQGLRDSINNYLNCTDYETENH